MTPEIVQAIAENSPLAAVAILALLILFKVMEQKVEMAKGMGDQQKDIAGRYKDLCDSAQTWGQQWIVALDRNTDAFNANMKVMSDTRDIIAGMKELLAKEKKTAAKAK